MIVINYIVFFQDSGEFKITVSRGEWHGKNCYVVHVTEETLRDTVSRVVNIIGNCTYTVVYSNTHQYWQ